MKNKKIIIIAILLSCSCILLGCSNSNSTQTASIENNATKSEAITESNSSQSTSLEKTDSTKNQTNKETNSDKKETNTKTDNVAKNNSIIFKSKLGFSINFPSNWKDRYIIKEDNNSMVVNFKSTDPNTPLNTGLIFLIMKNTDSINEDFYDSIDGKKHINIGNTTYFIGGPTDIGLDPENKDFSIYKSMKQELGQVINTMASLN